MKYINQCHYRHLMLAAQIHKRLLMSADTIKGDLIEKLFKIDGLFHVAGMKRRPFFLGLTFHYLDLPRCRRWDDRDQGKMR